MRLLKRVAAALAVLVAVLIAVGAYGWFVSPSVLVVPLLQVGYWRYGVQSLQVEVPCAPAGAGARAGAARTGGGAQPSVYAWPYLACGDERDPPMILLHGFGTSKDAMMMMMPSLAAQGYRVLAPDVPGFGDHPRHAGQHQDAAFYVREIGAFMDAVGAPRAVVLGTSMGGALAAELAIESPERVRAVALLSPAGVDPPVRNAFMKAVDRGELPLDIRNAADFDNITQLVFLRPPAVPGPFRDWFVQRALERRPDTLEIIESLRGFLENGLQGRLSGVRAPIFVLYGTEDAVTDPSMLTVFARELPSATTALVPNAGHVAFADNWPAVWVELKAFLDGVPKEPAP